MKFSYSLKNYKTIIYVWGADHGGYINRVEGVVIAISDKNVNFDV